MGMQQRYKHGFFNYKAHVKFKVQNNFDHMIFKITLAN